MARDVARRAIAERSQVLMESMIGAPTVHAYDVHDTHQGAIEVGRSGDDGARFTVLLPVADVASRGPSESVPPTDGPIAVPRAPSAEPPAAARVALP